MSTLLQHLTAQESVRHETERVRLLAALQAELAALLPKGERVCLAFEDHFDKRGRRPS